MAVKLHRPPTARQSAAAISRLTDAASRTYADATAAWDRWMGARAELGRVASEKWDERRFLLATEAERRADAEFTAASEADCAAWNALRDYRESIR